MTPENEDLLRRLAVIDESVLESLFGIVLGGHEPEEPDAKTAALVRLAGLVALDSAAASYHWSVTAALAAGASDDEVVGVLVALTPIVGTARVASAAPEVALAIGCDLGIPSDT
jgi:alkylhydroperoxidase/carboxymuconolactone decarboxylase family protein YurZ